MDFYEDAIDILCYGTTDNPKKVRLMLEDEESPQTKEVITMLYDSVIEKGHIDFGDIPKSKGNIKSYSGYKNLVEIIGILERMSVSSKTYADLEKYVKILDTAMSNLEHFAPEYQQGFSAKIDMVMIEYNSFVYTLIEATTSMLYQFTDFLKTPSTDILTVSLKDTKYRADVFYIDQLKKYNAVCASGKYKIYLKTMINQGKEGALGSALLVGTLAVVVPVMISIIPVTRSLIYHFQNIRERLADCLTLQAYFLEQNKAYLEATKEHDEPKKKKIIAKQEKLKLKFLRLAEKLRVSSIRADELARKTLREEDRVINTSTIQDATSSGDIIIV